MLTHSLQSRYAPARYESMRIFDCDLWSIMPEFADQFDSIHVELWMDSDMTLRFCDSTNVTSTPTQRHAAHSSASKDEQTERTKLMSNNRCKLLVNIGDHAPTMNKFYDRAMCFCSVVSGCQWLTLQDAQIYAFWNARKRSNCCQCMWVLFFFLAQNPRLLQLCLVTAQISNYAHLQTNFCI